MRTSALIALLEAHVAEHGDTELHILRCVGCCGTHDERDPNIEMDRACGHFSHPGYTTQGCPEAVWTLI